MTTIRERLINEGQARFLPVAISTKFRDYLNSLPWIVSTLDWSRVQPHTVANISTSTFEELLTWARASALGKHSHLALCFSPEDPCLFPPLEQGIRHLDELFWQHPGVHFGFGVDVVGGDTRVYFDDLLQYGDGDLLFARSR